MTGYHVGLNGILCQRNGNRMNEYCWLSYFGLLELISRASKHNFCDVETQYAIGRIKKLLGYGIGIVNIFAHACKLCALPGENKCFHYLDF